MIQHLFPSSTRVNRIVPKRTFIDKLGANARMKEHFTRDVVSIEWFAKFAPSTLNIADGLDVHEIVVCVVPLKDKECPDDIFVFIDKMMPRHLLFILKYEEEVCMLINYKQWQFRTAIQSHSHLSLSVDVTTGFDRQSTSSHDGWSIRIISATNSWNAHYL